MKKYLLLLFFAALLASCGKEEQKVKVGGALKMVGKALADGYSCDSTHYYYNGDTIEVAQPSTFKVLGGGYAKDGYLPITRARKCKVRRAHRLDGWLATRQQM